MGNFGLSETSVRQQITSAIGLIIQISRMKDGSRRVTNVSEITGMEGDIICMQDLFAFEYIGDDETGKVLGELRSSGFQPRFTEKAAYFGLDKEVIAAMEG